ncbi:MAG: chromosome segregation protein SMC [Verrucomicrobiales bacterium]
MVLKSLQLLGFKSFSEKTVIDFHPGVTGIVGPNGCGKSNVVDAIKWVLGETSAKALRGAEMADVIFNGTDKRQPHGLAEVTLTFSACEEALGVDYNEVAITRRVYRDGKGEYALNGTQCRLRDINELFMDTGIGQSAYSIMEQGKIDQLLSSKPEDRRAVFEEAAGITKFKTQKREALRKLDYTEANLLRVTDIIAELKRQMGSMQRQAQKARRYQEVHRDLRVLDTHLGHRRFLEWAAEKSELATSIGSLSSASSRLAGEISSNEEAIQNLRLALERTDGQLALLRSQINEQNTRIHGAENRIGFNVERTRELEVLIARNHDEISTTSSRLAEQEEEIRSADETLISVQANIQRQQSQIADHAERAHRHRGEREQIERELREVRSLSHQSESAIISANAQLSNNQAQLDSDGRRDEQLGAEMSRLAAEREERIAEDHRLEAELGALGQERAGRENSMQDAQHELRQTQADLASAQRQLRDAHRALAEKKSRLTVLEQLMATGQGLEKGTQQVLTGLSDPQFYSSSIRGLLSTYLEVEPEYVRAIEAALGQHLQTVLVADPAMAEAMVDALTRDRLGEAVLLPESFIPRELPRQVLSLPCGSCAWASDHVRVRSPAGPVIDHLLGNVLIVPDLGTALKLRQSHPELAFATLNGEFVSAQGIIRGGRSTEEPTSMLQRQNDIRQLHADVETGEQQLQVLEAGAAAMAGMVSGFQEQLAEIAGLLQQTQLNESSVEGQILAIKKEIASSANRIDSLRWEHDEVIKRRGGIEQALGGLRARLAEAQLELEAHGARASELDHLLANAARQEADSADLLNEMKTALAIEHRAAESLQHQRDPMLGRLRELKALITRRQDESNAYAERISAAADESERLESEISECQSQVEQLEAALRAEQSQRASQAENISRLENQLSAARRQSAIIAEQRGREEVKATQITLRLENLSAAINERYHTTLEAFEADVHTLVLTLGNVRNKRAAAEKRRQTLAGRTDTESSEQLSPAFFAHPNDFAEAAAIQSAFDSSAHDSEAPVDRTEFIETDSAIDWSEVELFVSELKQRLDAMGAVNLDAIQEFEELEERFNFLEKENSDLTRSKAELLSIIQKINVETRRMFAETFEEVRQNFQKTFRELFGHGAYSNLVLVNEEDPLESGIDIIAKPPGKKPQSISLLSGGERSMTAVALLFSIYMVKPAPFCVLDELDAPLDEANIGRFLQMLDKFIDKSQFVIVTHNKKTMRRADVLYGITMEEFGISKPVGMKMTSEEKRDVAPVGDAA